ncbi:MAG: SWF/SNF helicase family protein, partial [Salinibacterium sp.]|nr:SWF/SNF helicase family protein [Salinibacterium sp.]
NLDQDTPRWCTSHGAHWIVKDPEALGAYLQEEGIALRRTHEDAEVASTLPGQSKTIIEVEWDDGAVMSDRELQRRLAQRVLSGGFHERGQAARELDMLMRQETGIAKARSVAAYVRTLAEAGEAVLVGAWHREVYRILNERLADLNPVMFTGSESPASKKRSKAAFVAGDTNIMLMSLRAGAGLDGLQHRAAHIVYAELDWSPQVHQQLTGRVHRDGQGDTTMEYWPVSTEGSDPVILDTLGVKRWQSDAVIDPKGERLLEVKADPDAMRRLAEDYLRRRGLDPSKPPAERESP